MKKLRNAAGRVVKLRARALFGRKKAIRQRVVERGIDRQVNTSRLERLNGTRQGQHARLARRTRRVSRGELWLEWSLWRNVYN